MHPKIPLEIIGTDAVVAIDGSKFKAVNSRDNWRARFQKIC
jgi:hypothetical protein